MDISEIRPQELLKASWLPVYEASIDALSRQFVMLTSCLLALKKLLCFPPDHFEVTPLLFWRLIEDALFETCVLIIWRTATDPRRDVLTLRNLKDAIELQAKDEYSVRLKAATKQSGYDEKIALIGGRINDLRSNFIAHINKDRQLRPSSVDLKDDREILDELKGYTDTVCAYFHLLCFGNKQNLIPWGYSSEPNDPLGIDNILLRIARNSPMLNAPESNPDLWTGIRQGLSQEEIDTLNHYRERLNLPFA